MTALGYLSGQATRIDDVAKPKCCSDCERLWREYHHSARTYASMMQAEYVLADEPDEMPAIAAAIRSAAATWSHCRADLLRHDAIHNRTASVPDTRD
jgi:hypothetical protein